MDSPPPPSKDSPPPPSKEISDELTRELLIAISSSVPDNSNAQPQPPSLSLDDNNNNTNGGDNTEKYISELISISNAQPTDVKVLPVAAVNRKKV